jgi:competence protein ComEC
MRREAPFLSLVLALSCGVLLQQFTSFNPTTPWRAAAITILLVLVFYHLFYRSLVSRVGNVLFPLFFHALLLFAGIELAALNDQSERAAAVLSDKDEHYILRVLEPLNELANSTGARVEILSGTKADQWESIGLEAQIYFPKNKRLLELRRGDELVVKARINLPDTAKLPGTFDYRAYLKHKNIWFSFYVPEWQMLHRNQHHDITGHAQTIRFYLSDQLQQLCRHENNAAILQALILGDRSDLDRNLTETFARTGVVHVLAVSGLHVGILYLVFNALLMPLLRFRRSKWLYSVLMLACLWGYAFLSGLTPSVTRATLMFSIVLFGKSISRKNFSWNTMAFSAFLIICWQPFVIFQTGFQLSYAALAGILAFGLPLQRLLKTGDWLADQALGLLVISAAAQLGTLPVSLYYFGQFPNLFFLSNILVIPLITLVLYLSLGAMLLHSLGATILAKFIIAPAEIYLSVIQDSMEWLSGLPYAWTGNLYMSVWQTLFSGAAIFGLAWALNSRSYKPLILSFLATGVLFIPPWLYKDEPKVEAFSVPLGYQGESAFLWLQGYRAFCLLPDAQYAEMGRETQAIEVFCSRQSAELEWVPMTLAGGLRYLNSWGWYSTGKGNFQVFGVDYFLSEDDEPMLVSSSR